MDDFVSIVKVLRKASVLNKKGKPIMAGQEFPHLYEHNEKLRVVDPSSPDNGRIGEVWVISKDTIAERNPNQEVTYTITFTDKQGGTKTFYESQLSLTLSISRCEGKRVGQAIE
jgi:hypothetical protein